MAATVSFAKLVQLVKKGMGHSAAAAELGVTVGQISSLVFSQALVEAGKATKAPATAASVKKLRDGESNRWELIAARTGTSVGKAKELYEEAGGDASTSTTGRGRPSGSTSGGSKSKSASGSKSKSASKSGAKSKTKSAGRKTKASSARPPARARTLAERRAQRAGNPS